MPERTFTIVAVQDGKTPLYMDNQNISYSVMWGLGSAELLSQLSFVERFSEDETWTFVSGKRH